MILSERDYYLGFSVFSDFGPVIFKQFLNYFGSAKAAWMANARELQKINLKSQLIAKFSKFRSEFAFNSFLMDLKNKNINFIVPADPGFPDLLKEIPDCPIVLYFRGNIDYFSDKNLKIGIVGTRTMTVYGRQSTISIVTQLIRKKLTIVSGMAAGIDTVAHQTTLDNFGITIAVLGCGIDKVYPASNYGLYWSIIKKGLVVSEYPPGVLPSRSSFPLRNRIISGLSNCIVVVEGRNKSGALITAKYAADQGRDVFAVPGPINSPTSEATSFLIKNGAAIATSANDILESINTSGH